MNSKLQSLEIAGKHAVNIHQWQQNGTHLLIQIFGSKPFTDLFSKNSPRLLLLPGLRVVNSLPMKISVTLQRDHISRDETCEMEPGGQVAWFFCFLLMFFNHDYPHFDRGICDFGRSPFGCQLLLSVDGEEPQSLASWSWLAKTKKMNDGLVIFQIQIRAAKSRKN